MTLAKRRQTTVTAVLAAALLAGGSTAPPPTLSVTASAPALDAYLIGKRLSGAVMVTRGTEVLFDKGYRFASVAAGVPNTAHTRFRIGSVTKQFTALAVLKLQELGRLKVTDRVCRHISPCPAAWKAITIEHLLTHTSGIPEYFAVYAQDATMTPLAPVQVIDLFRDKPLDFPPGSRWSYSNSGYALLGYVIDRITGDTYANFVRRQILEPLGLSETGYGVNYPSVLTHAIGYTIGGNIAPFHDMSIPYAAGAMISTTADLHRWNQFLLTGTPKIVDSTSLAQMFTARVPVEPGQANAWAWYGYGWYIGGTAADPTYFHDGGIAGFVAHNEIRPRQQLSITILSNVDTTDIIWIANHMPL
jgi:CubicO group peptidase (beta-lactamase class C family)